MFDVPSDRDLLSVVRYFRNHAPLVRKEGYILFKDDLITLKPWMDSSGLDDFYKELLANGRPNWLRRVSFPRIMCFILDPNWPNIMAVDERQRCECISVASLPEHPHPAPYRSGPR